MKNLVLIGLFSLLSLGLFGQQQPGYSMYLTNGLTLNPAYAGSKNHVTTSLIHRRQWSGFPGSPITTSTLLHGPSRNQRNGYGFTLMYDKISAWRQMEFAFTYAKRFPIGKKGNLAIGGSAGLGQIKNDLHLLQTNVVSDPAIPSTSVSHIWPRLSAGLRLTAGDFHVGLSVAEPFAKTATVIGKVDPVRHINLVSGVKIAFSEFIAFQPSILYKIAAQSGSSLDANGSFIIKDKVLLGAGYRTTGALIFWTEIQMSRQLRFGYAYDHITKKLTGSAWPGSHELMLTFDFRFIKHGVDSMRYF